MNRAATAAVLAAITLLSWFWFPGHTWLHQDSQIYAAILEHQWDPSTLAKDILVQQPHVSFTLYDEIANGLRWLLHAPLRPVLQGEQLFFRLLGFFGVYLLATSLRFSPPFALVITTLYSLGATIIGPAVLSIEYEPTPRAFAIPLLFLAIGLLSIGRPVWAGVAAGCAVLLHVPAALPFWGVLLLAAIFLRERRLWLAFLPLAAALLVLTIVVVIEPASGEHQQFFGRVPPDIEQLQRLRAAYNWVSTWGATFFPSYVVLWLGSCVAVWQLRARIGQLLRWFVVVLPLVGLLSVPLSWLLLEQMKWTLIPQLQPARALLFVTALAQILFAAAACDAVLNRHWLRAFLWFSAALAAAVGVRNPRVVYTVLALALAFALLLRAHPRNAFAVAAAYFVLPLVGQIHNYPFLRTPDLLNLSAWAGQHTARDAVFFFPNAAHSTQPGIFRADSLRALYVDWKGGGQVNYLPELGREWWRRWHGPAPHAGVDYVVVTQPLPNQTPVYRNPGYLVYRNQ